MPFSPTRSSLPARLSRLSVRALAVSAAFVLLAACNPALNWREVRSNDGALLALFPCKAEGSSRKVSLGGQEVEMALKSCTASEALFVVGQAAIPEAQALVALKHWQQAVLTNIAVPPSSLVNPAIKESPQPVAGLTTTPLLLKTEGNRTDGTGVQFTGLWFTRGGQVFHAAIYAGKLTAEMSEPFFAGLKLR